MAVVVGSGFGNRAPWNLLTSVFQFSAPNDSSFTAGAAFWGTLSVIGSGFTYGDYALTGGTITGVHFSGGASGATEQTWANLNVSAAALFNAVAARDEATFYNLLFGGADTFTYSNLANGNEYGFPTGLVGASGNDTFNISGWNFGASIDGGSDYDTINLTGGVADTGFTIGNTYYTPYPNFRVTNVERINLGAGYNYTIHADNNLVASGARLDIDGSALGASNSFVFDTQTAANGSAFAGTIALTGGAGNDFFQGGAGLNFFYGGGGTDTVSFNAGLYHGTGVTANLSLAGIQQSIGGGASAVFVGIENLTGTIYGDTLTGDDGDNVLNGNNAFYNGGSFGGDVLNGGGGNDTFILSDGTVDGGAGVDTVDFRSTNMRSYDYTFSYSNGVTTLTGLTGKIISLVNVEYAQFLDKTVMLFGATLNTSNVSTQRNQSLALSSLFTLTNVHDPIIKYQLRDTTTDPYSGHFVVLGVDQPAGTTIEIGAGQLSQTFFVSGKVNDNLQIRAFDGTFWTTDENAAWAPFTVSVPADNPPSVVTADMAAQRNQTLAVASLFTVSDDDGDPIVKYQLWDGSDDPLSGHFVINGVVQPAKTVIEIDPSQLAQVSFVTGRAPDRLQIRAFDGIAWSMPDTAQWSPFTITPANTAPVVTTGNMTVQHDRTLALSGLFTVGDADNDPISKYQLWDTTTDPNSGHFVVNGVAQAPRTVIEVTAAQLSQVSFVTGTVGDLLQIRASDGVAWSAADSAQWSPFNITVPANHAPVLTTTDVAAQRNQTLALTGLFSVGDADNDAITKYQLWDTTTDPNSGHFVVNGVAQAPRTVIEITGAQLAQTSFVTGSVADYLQIRANDGAAWSAADSAQWSPFNVTVPINHAPVLATSDVAAQRNQSLALSSLFTVTDADNDTITKYQLWDTTTDPNSGHFVVGGVAQAPRTVIEVTASQLAQTSFVTGSVADYLQIRAFDGTAWSAADAAQWSPFNVTVPVNHAPVLATSDVAAQKNQTLALTDLFTVNDTDNDTITKYQLWDTTTDPNSGHFVVGGVAQAPRTVIEVTASQLAQTSFVTGSAGDYLQIRGFDGTAWSAADAAQWSPFNVTVPVNHAPVLATSDVAAQKNQTLALTGLFTVNDTDNDTITRYQLWDTTTDPNSGHFVVNGVAQTPRTVIELTASQLAQTSFVTGSAGDYLQIRAFDGTAWSAADSAQWSPFNVTVPPNHAPVVTTGDIATSAGQGLAASSLFTVSDADNDTITKYQFWDTTADPASGHFVVNGVAQAPRTVIEMPASDLSQVSFLTGSSGDMLQVRAFDGTAWSAADSAMWSPFHIAIS